MQIVIYRAQGKDWQMTRVGHSGSYFFTAPQKPTQFKDGRTARGFARSCARFAREKLGWKDAVFDAVPYEDFKQLHLSNVKGAPAVAV